VWQGCRQVTVHPDHSGELYQTVGIVGSYIPRGITTKGRVLGILG
jgi:hypothetical protein